MSYAQCEFFQLWCATALRIIGGKNAKGFINDQKEATTSVQCGQSTDEIQVSSLMWLVSASHARSRLTRSQTSILTITHLQSNRCRLLDEYQRRRVFRYRAITCALHHSDTWCVDVNKALNFSNTIQAPHRATPKSRLTRKLYVTVRLTLKKLLSTQLTMLLTLLARWVDGH